MNKQNTTKPNTTAKQDAETKRFGFLQSEINKTENALASLKGEQAAIDELMSAVVGVDYRWINRIIKITKAGKTTDSSSRAILFVTLKDGRKVDFVDFSHEIGAFAFFNEFTKVYGPDDIKVVKVALLDRLALPVSDGARAACDTALKKKQNAADRRRARDVKTYEEGKDSFMSTKNEQAERAWTRLEERVGL